jgi:hypothetical protein
MLFEKRNSIYVCMYYIHVYFDALFYEALFNEYRSDSDVLYVGRMAVNKGLKPSFVVSRQ